MKKGEKMSEESRKKLSSSTMGRIPWNKGKKRPPFSEEWKKKMSLASKGKPKSEETRKRMSKARIGWKYSEETKEKIRMGMMGKIPWDKGVQRIEMMGEKNPMWGRKFTEEHRKKIGDSHRGEKSVLWLGGTSPYGSDWSEDLRESIRKRDNYICQLCEIPQDELIGKFKKLAVHHIDYNKFNLDPLNLVSLCSRCHAKTNFNRDYWTDYFYRNIDFSLSG